MKKIEFKTKLTLLSRLVRAIPSVQQFLKHIVLCADWLRHLLQLHMHTHLSPNAIEL